MRKIDELQQLENEIHRLRLKARNLEKELDNRIDYFQDNYRSIALKSLLPTFLSRAGLTGSILDVLMENKQVRNTVNKLTGILFDKISDGINFLTAKFSKKESSKEAAD